MKGFQKGIASLAIALFGVAISVFAEAPDDEAYRAWGKELFAAHCAPCHGQDGRGNGPVARQLKTPPKDLTRIAEEYHGSFPPNFVEEVIDGRRYFMAHGDRVMPIWGEEFASGKGDYAARIRVYALQMYLRSIQTAPVTRTAP